MSGLAKLSGFSRPLFAFRLINKNKIFDLKKQAF